jgi:hypothetical protein
MREAAARTLSQKSVHLRAGSWMEPEGGSLIRGIRYFGQERNSGEVALERLRCARR